MRAREFINEDKTTLKKLYSGNFPDRDELFWDYVTQNDLSKPLDIQTLPAYKTRMILQWQYRGEHLDDILDMLDEDQQTILQKYMDDPALSSKIIVIADSRIIDGNHRALAAALKNVSIRYVDLDELNDVLSERRRKKKRRSIKKRGVYGPVPYYGVYFGTGEGDGGGEG